ncbi:MAG: gamma-glutamyltransferase [Gammaproteobacteria bacterium]
MLKLRNKLIAAVVIVFALALQYTYAADGRAAIASAHPLATYAGFEVLDQGGNAFDAAVAVSAALAVVEPTGSGLGGGGFWLLHRAADGFDTMLDGREKAPSAAHKAMYLDGDGRVIRGLSTDGPLSAGIPGLPAALAELSERYGRLPLRTALQPAIRYARDGFTVGERYRKMLRFRLNVLQRYESTAAIFLHNGAIPEAGWLLKQPDLANTLARLAESGRSGFYSGDVAAKLVEGIRAAGGIWRLEDLDAYRAVERKPVTGRYQNIEITSAALPSAGGIGLIEILNVLAGFDLNNAGTVGRKHLIVEAMRRAYHDRALYLGDSDFIEVPVARLISPDYAAGLASTIRPDRILPSSALSGDMPASAGGDNTTHFSIVDADGNRVAATLSVNFPFGSGFVAKGTGVLLNDEMDDFVSLPGAQNGYGLVGGAANEIAPGKRMLSSMTPTFLEDDKRIAVLGTPGGSRIISMVLLAALDFANGNGPESWVKVPRFHHQYIPDSIQYEPGGLSDSEIAGLAALGHVLNPTSYRYGDMHAVQLSKDSGRLEAASDPRGEGLALVK